MIQDEFKKLLEFFAQSAEGKPVNLQEVLGESLQFFNQLKTRLLTGSEEEKKELLGMVNEMYSKLMVESRKMAERAGLSEEQLALFVENPGNFSPEQWAAMNQAKQKMDESTNDLVKALNKSGIKEKDAQEAQEQKKGSTPKRTGWIRS